MRQDEVPLAQRLLVRPEEAASLLGLGRSTIYELLRTGELPVVHVGRAARIPMRELRRWIERQYEYHDLIGADSGGSVATTGAPLIPPQHPSTDLSSSPSRANSPS